MPKVKIHPLILLALSISSITMILYTYRSYSNQEVGLSITFALLFVFFLALVVSGIIRNKKIDINKK